MSCQLVSRLTRPAIYLGAFRHPIAFRKLTITPALSAQSQGKPGSDQKQPPPSPEGSNTLIILSALGALGGLYYYYTRGQPALHREAARRKEEEMERRVNEIGDAGRNKVESVAKQGQRDYEKARDTVRARATETGTDLAERARQSAHEAQAKFGEYKDTAERKVGDIRDRSEKTIREDEEEIARQVNAAQSKARGWFGWGSSK